MYVVKYIKHARVFRDKLFFSKFDMWITT